MDGRKTVSSEDLKQYFSKDLFAQHVGIELVDAGDGRARAKLSVADHHLNGVRGIHGGAIFTLADLAFAAAANSRGRVAVAISCSIQFINAAAGTVIYADAREISRNKRLASYTVTVTDESGTIISLFQGMAYRKKDPLEHLGDA